MANKTRYGWQFPDGEVIPVDDEDALRDKLLDYDGLRRILSDDEYYRGYWYNDHYYSMLEREVEGTSDEQKMDYYGVETIYPRNNGPVKYRLPTGEVVDVQGFYDWLEFEGYPFDEWFKYERFGDEFKEYARDEVDNILYWNNPDDFEHYGLVRVPLESESPRGPPKKAPARKKTPAKNTTNKAASKSNKKASAKPKSPSKAKGRC